jgi:NIMA-interacting peptidyl-prolyl cis-trans isomerase 1
MQCSSRLFLRAFALIVGLGSAAACAHRQPSPAASAPAAQLSTASAKPSAPPEQLEIRLLVVAYEGADHAPDGTHRTRAEALERANLLASMARSGEHLSDLVATYSDRASAGDSRGVVRIAPAEPAPFTSQLVDAALALTTARISDPVETPQGFVVIERLKDPVAGPDKIAAKHILISYESAPHAIPGVTRNEAEARALAETIVVQARKPNADWGALAAQYTDEPGSKNTGGDLGKFGRGQMVPAFEKTAFKLAVGEVSEVVQTPFGFHVIQRYE